MTNVALLNIIGWVVLISSWIVPMMMKKESSDRHYVGITLAAISMGIFVSGLVVQLIG
jgi:hypothetical protein